MDQKSNSIVSPARVASKLDIIASFTGKALFWRPRYLKDSAFLPHLPFLFWLIEVQRPRCFVELGVGEGVSYFGACQALDKSDIDARCYGIVVSPDNEGKGEVSGDLLERNAELYSEFSQVIAGSVTEAPRRIRDGSVDVIHVNFDATANEIDSIKHDWLRKLSDRGVILLHGTNSRFAEGARLNFLEELASTYPTIKLSSGDGLAAILWGPDRSDPLLRLAELSYSDPGYVEIHNAFVRLGSASHFEWSSRRDRERAAKAEEHLHRSKEKQEQLQHDLFELSAQYKERSHQAALWQSKHFDLQNENGLLKAELIERDEMFNAKAAAEASLQRQIEELKSIFQNEIDVLRGELKSRDERLAFLSSTEVELQREMDALKGELKGGEERLKESMVSASSLQVQLDKRSTEIATLTAYIEKLNSARDEALALKVAASESRKQSSNLQKELEKLKEQLNKAEKRHQKIKQSVSWRITAPIRKLPNLPWVKKG